MEIQAYCSAVICLQLVVEIVPVSVEAEPPSLAAASKAVARTVITFTGSIDSIVWIAFPA